MMIALFYIYFTFAAEECPSSFNFEGITSIKDRAYENCANTIGIDLEIPANVTEIGSNSFYGCTGIKGKLIINADCYQLGSGAFDGCTGITEVTLNEKIGSIKDNCFKYCSNLNKITFPKSLKIIGNGAFYQCNKLTMKIDSDSELFIYGSFAFYNCSKINSINFNTQHPINIGYYSFSCCNGLTSLTFPSNIDEINNYAFYNCTNLQTINIQNCPPLKGIGVFEKCSNLQGTIQIPSKWKTIKEKTFAYCTKITGLTLHENLEKIEERAFYKCSQLKGRLAIQNSNMKIESEAFYGCSQLEQITNFNRITDFDTAAFAGCSSLTTVLEFNDKITTIPTYSFYGCSSMIGPLKISNKISKIMDYAFCNCSQLTIDTDFDLSNCEHIYDYSFYNCKSIKGELILSDKIKEIGNFAFYNCSSLIGELIINISDYYWEDSSVTIGDYAFYGCSGFEGDFIINSCIGRIGKESFGLTNFDQIIYNFTYAPCCSESIGENIYIYVPVNYKPESFGKNKFIRDLPYIAINDIDETDIIAIKLYGLGDYNEFYFNYFNDLFASENNENKTYINYFSYNNNNDRLLIFNHTMKPNQFFELDYHAGMLIDHYGGQLNLYNPKDYIRIYDTFDFNVSIMGTGFLIFKPWYTLEADNSTKHHINVFSNSTFTDTFQFQLDDSKKIIGSISIEDVTLVINGSILPVEYVDIYGENIEVPKVKINKLTVEPYTNATIDSAIITGTFLLKHNSKVKLINVDLTEAEMVYEMSPYINKNNVLTGSISSKPKSFTILEPEDPKRYFKKEIILIDANFDCKNWNISINQNSKYFDKYECVEISSSNKHYQLKLITKNDSPPINDDDDDENNDNNNNNQDKKEKCSDKLSIGIIVGIVVGCVVVVAALMIAEYFIITRCKRNKDASKNEGNEDL